MFLYKINKLKKKTTNNEMKLYATYITFSNEDKMVAIVFSDFFYRLLVLNFIKGKT